MPSYTLNSAPAVNAYEPRTRENYERLSGKSTDVLARYLRFISPRNLPDKVLLAIDKERRAKISAIEDILKERAAKTVPLERPSFDFAAIQGTISDYDLKQQRNNDLRMKRKLHPFEYMLSLIFSGGIAKV